MRKEILFMSERPRVGAAVQQQILAGNVTRLRAAQIGAGIAEFLDAAEAARRVRLGAGLAQLLVAPAARLGVELEVRAQPVGVERAGQQVVDGHVVAHGLARQPGDEAGEAGARAVRQAELGDRVLHRARGDVDDAPEAVRHHAVDHRADHQDRRDHVGLERLDPGLAVPVAKVAGRRAAGVVDQDVGRGAGAQLRGRRLQRLAPARGDDEIHAFRRERRGAALAEAFRRRADEGGFAANSEVHDFFLGLENVHARELSVTRRTPAMTSSPPAACRQVNGSSRPSALVSVTLTGPTAPIRAKRLAPMRLSASACRNTGNTVLQVAMMAAYHHTAAGSSRARTGSSTTNCAAAGTLATTMVNAVKRMEPTRFTIWLPATR